MRWSIVSCLLFGACIPPAADIQSGQTLTSGANGDVTCDGGTIVLADPGVSINGDLDATDCVLKISGIVNGHIHATGGIVHVLDAVSVNGELVVHGAIDAEIESSNFNGGGDIEDTATVNVDSNTFNGSLTIAGALSCSEDGDITNGTLSAPGCGGPMTP